LFVVVLGHIFIERPTHRRNRVGPILADAHQVKKWWNLHLCFLWNCSCTPSCYSAWNRSGGSL